MSTYKVLQDIEAEDTIVGPLTLRQLIYALVCAVCLYICFLSVTRNATFMIVFFLPLAGITGFFAFPWKGEQPTEIWALARLRFMVLPRVRVWSQSGIKEVVTVTAPRKAPVQMQRRSLTQNEVRSRLKALADTIDTRGWATRNANFQYYVNAAGQAKQPSDRLVNASGLQPGSIPADAFLPANDMLDDRNPIAQNLDAMLNKSSANQRQRVIQQMAQTAQAAQNQIPTQLNQPAQSIQTLQSGHMAQPLQVRQTQLPQLPSVQLSPQLPAPALPIAPAVTLPPAAPMPQIIPQAPTQTATQAAPVTPVAPTVPTVPTVPITPGQATQQFSAPPSDHWFLNPPAHPAAVPAPAPIQPSADQQALTAAQQQGRQAAPVAADTFAISPSGVLGPVPAAEPTAAEQAMAQTMVQQNKPVIKINYNHMRVLQPSGDSDLPVNDDIIHRGDATNGVNGASGQPVTRKADPAILELANNDDLDVATIARQANKEMNKAPDEVEIRLH